MIPGAANPQNWNRYSYVQNRPVNYNDPTGHKAAEGTGTGGYCDAKCKEYKEQLSSKLKDKGKRGGKGDDWWNDVPSYSYDGGWNNPNYSTWNLLRRGSGCTACHVTHDQPGDWGIPTNSEIDPSLVAYYRSNDALSRTIHMSAGAYVAANTALAIEISSFGNTGYTYMTKDDYLEYGASWGKNQVFVTDEAGAAMVAEQTSVSGVNDVLGTNFPEGSTIYQVEIPNIHSYNPQYPISGNSQFIPGGYTMGGAPERVISPLNIREFARAVLTLIP